MLEGRKAGSSLVFLLEESGEEFFEFDDDEEGEAAEEEPFPECSIPIAGVSAKGCSFQKREALGKLQDVFESDTRNFAERLAR